MGRDQGIERLSQLRSADYAAKAREDAEAEAQAQADIEEKRELIQSVDGRFVSPQPSFSGYES